MIGPLATALASILALAPLAAPPKAKPKSIALVDQTWVCKDEVDLTSVKVTMTKAAIGLRRNEDAVHLQPGCTGRIGRIEIVQYAADGIKVAEGVHDLTIGGGSVRCLGKAPHLHQDGIQVMGGTRITFKGLEIDCGRSTDRLINSNLFIRQAGRSLSPPTDVVCDGCTFGGWAAHTVSVQSSIRSGVTGSSLCLARFPQLTLDIGADAVTPVRGGNTVHQCGPGQLTIASDTRNATYRDSVHLSGIFLAQALGSPVTLEGRAFDKPAFVPLATVRTNKGSRWLTRDHPGVQTTYRARLGAVVSPLLTVRVAPLVVLTRTRKRFIVRAYAKRPFGGRPFTVQRQVGRAWVDVADDTFAKNATKAFAIKGVKRGTKLRVLVPASPGFSAGTSKTLVVS